METKKTLSLFELPEILFHQFLNGLGVKDVKAFILKNENGHESNVICPYARLPKCGEYENPTLVFLDLKRKNAKTKVIMLTKPPLIKKGLVESLHDYASISAQQSGNKDEVFDITLNVNMPYLGFIQMGDPFVRFSFLYMLELSKKADELFHSKKFEWINQYTK